MSIYDVTLKDESTYYYIKANSEEEAKEKALKYWEQEYEYRKPSITIKEHKKRKRTIYFSETRYYKQDVLVDKDMNEDEIINLWTENKIETLNGPVEDDNRYNKINAVCVKM